jgi:hypothetical protein
MKRFLLVALLTFLLVVPFAVNQAGADAILFPWVTKSASVSTLISVVNTAAGDPDFDELIHLQYWYKDENGTNADPDINAQDNTCAQQSFKMTTSKDDLVTWDAAGNINSGEALFGDTNSNPQLADNMALSADGARRAFLIVDNNTFNIANVGRNIDGTLYGEAMLIELPTGAAWGYIAYNASGGDTTGQNQPVWFDDAVEVNGEVIGDAETTQTIVFPPDKDTGVTSTKVFVTPMDVLDTIPAGLPAAPTDGDHQARNQRVGNANVRVQLCKDPDQAGDCDEGGIWDNEEGAIDFTNKKNIVCTTADDIADLMDPGSYLLLQASGSSAWAYFVTHFGTVDVAPFNLIADNPTADATVGVLDLTETGMTIDGTTVPTGVGSGAINSFVWLRDGGSGVGIDYIHNEEYLPTP